MTGFKYDTKLPKKETANVVCLGVWVFPDIYFSLPFFMCVCVCVFLLTFTMKARVPFSFCGITMLCTVKTNRASLETPEAQKKSSWVKESDLKLPKVRFETDLKSQKLRNSKTEPYSEHNGTTHNTNLCAESVCCLGNQLKDLHFADNH